MAEGHVSVQDGSNYNRVGNTITPALDFNGTLSVPVTVSAGTAESPLFLVSVTVNAVNGPSVISSIADQVTPEDTVVGPIGFTVGDVEMAAEELIVTGSSDNQSLVPDANIVFGGSGANRTIAVTPAANQSGTAVITIMVSDGTGVISETFTLTVSAVRDAPTNSVLPQISGLLEEGQVLSVTAGTWQDHSNPAGTLIQLQNSHNPIAKLC